MHGAELWRTDQTFHHPQLLHDINPGRGDATITLVGDVGARYYFAADDGRGDRALWCTDGTPSGTVRLAAIGYSERSGLPTYFDAMGATLLFVSEDGGDSVSLWTTDGSATHTKRLATFDLNGAYPEEMLTSLGTRGNTLFFQVKANSATDTSTQRTTL